MAVPEIVVDAAGRPLQATDGHGHTAWSLRWDGERLAHARLRLPDGDAIVLQPGTAAHAVLGPCDALHRADDAGPILARIAAVQWYAPACIPAVDVPGALPPGAGTAILNLLAVLAQTAGVASLRYRGPYPTSALFATLRSSFAVVGDPTAAERRFVDVAERDGFGMHALVPDVDFLPDPHAWSWPAPRVCVEHRRGLSRVWIDARAYDPDGEHHVLVHDRDRWIARVVLAGQPWCDVLAIDTDGAPCGAIATPPPVAPELVGVALPDPMVEVIAAVIAREAAAPLRAAIGDVLAHGITLADTGVSPARMGPDGVLVHASLVERALALPGPASIAALVGALRAVTLRAAVARLLLRFPNDSNSPPPMSRLP